MPKTRLRQNCVSKSGHRKVALILKKWAIEAKIRKKAVGMKLPLPLGRLAFDAEGGEL